MPESNERARAAPDGNFSRPESPGYDAKVTGSGSPSPAPQTPAETGVEPRRTDSASVAPTHAESEQRKITGRAGIVALGTLLSRVLGLGRDLVLAAVFSRAATDAFFIAFTIPNVLRQLVAEGAVQTGVLPVLAKVREQQGESAARAFFRRLRGLSLCVLLLLSVLGVVFAPELVNLFASGFHDYAGQYERTVSLTRWVFPYILFMGTAALGLAALNTHHRFVVTSFAPALLNVAFIGFALLLPGWLVARGHDPILAVAFGALLGGVLQVVAQWPSLRKIGYFERPSLHFNDPAVREVLRRMAPTLLGIGIYYVDVILARRFLSELGVGAQSYFAWAMRLCDFPQGIFVMALQTATLPSLSALVARREMAEVSKTFAFGMRLTLFVGIPASLAIVALAEPLVVLLFQRGEFGASAARQTAYALMAQGAGVWAVAAVRQLVAVYFALGKTRTPVIVAGLDLIAFVILALSLKGPLGHVGISLAVAGASVVQMLLLWVLLLRELPDLRGKEILGSALRTLLAAGVAIGAALPSTQLVLTTIPPTPLGRLLPGLTGALVFSVVFLISARLLRSPELQMISSALARRAGRNRS